MNTNPCIYRILNKPEGISYVGATVRYSGRKALHVFQLRKGLHRNKRLQADWTRLGEGAFDFEILEECEVEDLCSKEIGWCEKFGCLDDARGYNEVRPTDKGFDVVKKYSRRPRYLPKRSEKVLFAKRLHPDKIREIVALLSPDNLDIQKALYESLKDENEALKNELAMCHKRNYRNLPTHPMDLKRSEFDQSI